jgi:hypothetical protein
MRERQCVIASQFGCDVVCPPGGCALARGLAVPGQRADGDPCLVEVAGGPDCDSRDRRAQLVSATLEVFDPVTPSELLSTLDLLDAVVDSPEDPAGPWAELMTRAEAANRRSEPRRARGWPMRA